MNLRKWEGMNTSLVQGKEGLYTHVLLDSSGSMLTIHKLTVDGFNEYITALKNSQTSGRVSLTTFSGDFTRDVRTGEDLASSQPLGPDEYRPMGGTPLFDAIAETITKIRAAVGESNPHITMVIITDGEENGSHRFTVHDVKNMLRRCQAEGWQILFMGANFAAEKLATEMGLKPENALEFNAQKIKQTFLAAAKATTRGEKGDFGGFLTDERKDVK